MKGEREEGVAQGPHGAVGSTRTLGQSGSGRGEDRSPGDDGGVLQVSRTMRGPEARDEGGETMGSDLDFVMGRFCRQVI